MALKLMVIVLMQQVSDSQVIWGYRKVIVPVKYYQRGSFHRWPQILEVCLSLPTYQLSSENDLPIFQGNWKMTAYIY